MIKRFAKRFFRWYCHPDYYAEIAGDLEEMYQRNVKQGWLWAQWKYLLQVISLFRPSLMRSFSQYLLTHPAMFKSYFKISTRILLKHKFYSAINILGLAVGMGVCLLIYQYIHFELSYDRFHENVQNIYRLTQTTIRNGENQGTGVYTTYALGPRSEEEIPEILDFVRIRPQDIDPVIINPENNEKFLEDGMWYVDSNFLQIFDFPLIYGDRESALAEKHSIVVTEQMATKYFGNTNPIGKSLKISLGVFSGDFIVTAVLKTLPANSHLQFNFLLPMVFLLEHGFYKEYDSKGWRLEYFITYIRLNEAAGLDDVEKKFYQLIATHTKRNTKDSNTEWKIGLQPITDVHLKSDFPRDFASNKGNMRDVQVFSIIVIFILLMAWVNYINLSTARTMHRAKEVGVRKTIGAVKKQLVSQFMVESFLINIMAALLSIGIAYCMLPVLNTIIGKELAFNVLQSLEFWVWFSMVIIFGSLLSGLYPAFVLSSFKPVSVLKSAKVTQKGGFSLRKGLILFQFLMSVLLISGTYLVYKQITFMKNQDLGIDMEKILVVEGARVVLESLKSEGVTLGSKYQAFKHKVVTHHAVSGVAFSGSVPSKGYYGTEGFWRVGAPEGTVQEGSVIIADVDFANTYDLEFLAKAAFSEEIPPEEKTIINEEAVKVFGLGSAEEALHEILVNNSGDSLEVLGVVENFHWSSLKEARSPVLFVLHNEWGAYFSIKMNLSDIQETITYIEDAYRSVFPNDPFHYFFLDDEFNRQYQSDLQFRNLFSAFSILAIFIACLGLFALVSFSATLRVKEIGIRKVFGASVGNLMMLLSREYMILLFIAIMLAVPAIIIGGKSWLENYAYKVGIGIDLFLIPGLILIVISLLTVSYRTYATASANPAESLRAE